MSRASELAEGIAEAVEERIDTDGPGVAILVVEEGEVVHAKGYGLADLSGQPITAHSVFDLASLSKHITGMATSLLIERGRIAPEDPVAQHVRALQLEEEGRAITIQDLLWHVSGLPDYTGDAWDGTDEEFARLTPAGLVAWLNGQELVSAPGVEHVYNNSGYALLARVVEEVSGQSYASFVEANLFRPLGMKHTVALDSLSRKLPNRVTGYTSKGGKVKKAFNPTVIQGDGNVFTCIADLALWEIGLQRAKLVSRAALERAWTSGTLDDGSTIEDENGYGYGYGWCVDADEDSPSISHDGSWGGTATSYVRYLDDEVSIIMLSNDDDADLEGLQGAVEEVVYAEE
ncbi:MAG: serine hydrolase domain-containing protein [Minicystis sp.]